MKKEKTKILVAEDSLTQAAEINFILSSAGYDVKCFDSGRKALDHLMSSSDYPDIIISDIVMPEMNGYELCKAIKAEEKFKDIPVILLTSLSDPSDVINGLIAGADNFITKPYNADFLISRINFIILNRELRQNRGTTFGIDIQFGGKNYTINSEKAQMLDLLFSSFENAVQKNTELNTAIHSLEVQGIELKAAKERAEAAVSAKTKFLATMSHEIRTPMNGILGMHELLADTPLNKEQAEYLHSIKVSASNLLSIINDILDYSKLESQLFTLEKKEFQFSKCVEDSLLTASSNLKVFQEGKLELMYFIHPHIPQTLIGDQMRIRQILLNLINNAIKFTQAGHVLLYIRPDYDSYSDFQYKDFPPNHLKEQVKNNEIKLKFIVADTGLGIKKEDLGKLFQSFTQIDSSTSRRHDGTGLGLAICKQLTTLMKGNIWVESEYQKGSKFNFTLTLDTKESETPQINQGSNITTKNKTALLYDDNLDSLAILSNYCDELGLLANSTNNIETVETLLLNTNYDYIFVDTTVAPAVLDKVYLILKKVASSDYKKICIIIGNYLDKKTIMNNLSANSNHNISWLFLPKPILKSALLSILSTVTFESAQDKKDEPAPVKQIEKIGQDKLKDIRILLAEDNLINQKVATNILKKSGFINVDIAEDGLKVLELLKNNLYDLIFMDVQMPNMDGLTATKEIRKTLSAPMQPKIIAMTANAMAEDETECLNVGMDGYLTKPISSEKILAIIKKHISI